MMLPLRRGAHALSVARQVLGLHRYRERGCQGSVVLTYHGFVPSARAGGPEAYCIDVPTLRRHLSFVRRRLCAVPLRQIVDILRAGGTPDRRWVAITCDDGLASQATLGADERKERVDRHEVAECTMKLGRAIAFDLADEIATTSRFVVVDDFEIRGGGIVRGTVTRDTQYVVSGDAGREAAVRPGNVSAAAAPLVAYYYLRDRQGP